MSSTTITTVSTPGSSFSVTLDPMSKAYEHKPQNAGKKKTIVRSVIEIKLQEKMHLTERNHFFMKWERGDGLGVKAENLKVEVKEGCKKQNIIIIYEIYESSKKNTTKSIILFIELAATTYLNANFPTNFCLHPILCMP